MSKLDLSRVTLCAADCITPALAARALERSQEGCGFGEAILLSDRPADGPFRTIPIAPLRSVRDYSRLVLRDLSRFVGTDFVLVIQWDGYVVNPAAWRDDFLDYDYIGAPWLDKGEHPVVGNGGFSLRSRRLLEAAAALPFDADKPEDAVVCIDHRAALEAQGIRFAPAAIAAQFSQEHGEPAAAPFGFHGAFNLWRYESDAAMAAIAGAVDDGTLMKQDYAHWLVNCFCQGQREAVTALYARWRESMSPQQVAEYLTAWTRDPSMSATCVNICEGLLAGARV